MATCKAPRKIRRPGRKDLPGGEARPPRPDRQLWEADEGRAFEAGVRWFLAVSRAA